MTFPDPMLRAGALAGRAAIITGGGTGMGRAMALQFASLGARVVVASRKQENLDATVAAIREAGGTALAVVTDVRDVAQIAHLVETTVAAYDGVDILVNNAAGNFLAQAIDLSPNGWKTVIDIVLNGTWFCSQAVAKQMITQGRGGVILNIIATYASSGAPGTAHSGAAKAGVQNLTQTLAVEWAPYGIRVNALAPGPILTENTKVQLFGGGAFVDAVTADVPLGRFGNEDEIAEAAAYLVCDHARYITGTTLTVDGGNSLNKGFAKYAPLASLRRRDGVSAASTETRISEA